MQEACMGQKDLHCNKSVHDLCCWSELTWHVLKGCRFVLPIYQATPNNDIFDIPYNKVTAAKGTIDWIATEF